MVIARSILFNILFYLNLVVLLIVAIPTLLMPSQRHHRDGEAVGPHQPVAAARRLRHQVEFRGLDKIPAGPLIVAAKHQSTWETFALLSLFKHPIFIIKRELTWIPLFGWFTSRAG